MSRRKVNLIASILLFLAFFGYSSYKQYYPSKKVLSLQEQKQTTTQTQVVKIIDGDTIEVLIDGKKEKVRVLGINTPETVDPRRPVECFGKEASDKAKSLLSNQSVRLESDPTQNDRDKYGRLLRYVFLSDGTDYGLTMIKDGYAYEYTYEIPYKFQKEYKKAQSEAENRQEGLWSSATCKGNE